MQVLDAVIVDTYPQNQLAKLAINQTVETGLVRNVHTFSTAPIYPGELFHPITPIHSAADYSHFLLNIVPYFVDAAAVLVIQWDGMPTKPEAWSDAFLRYDYIGAPWNDTDDLAVGNGGFSLRSTKLMQALRQLKIKCSADLPENDAEDVVICRHYRAPLEAMGCQFAPAALARQFAVENSDANDAFGFHGAFNLPKYLAEEKLLDSAVELCARTHHDLYLINFLVACHNRGYAELFNRVRSVLQSDTRYERIRSLMERAAYQLPGY